MFLLAHYLPIQNHRELKKTASEAIQRTVGAPGLGFSAKPRPNGILHPFRAFLPGQEWRGGPSTRAPCHRQSTPFRHWTHSGELLNLICSRSLLRPKLALLPAQEDVVISFPYATRRTAKGYSVQTRQPTPPSFGTKSNAPTTSDCLGRHNLGTFRAHDPQTHLSA